jgi:hypothetical protein
MYIFNHLSYLIASVKPTWRKLLHKVLVTWLPNTLLGMHVFWNVRLYHIRLRVFLSVSFCTDRFFVYSSYVSRKSVLDAKKLFPCFWKKEYRSIWWISLLSFSLWLIASRCSTHGFDAWGNYFVSWCEVWTVNVWIPYRSFIFFWFTAS